MKPSAAAPVRLVTARKESAARWRSLISALGAPCLQLESLADLKRQEPGPGLILLDWRLIEDGPEAAVRGALARGPGARVVVFAEEEALYGPALAKLLSAGASDLIPAGGADAPLARRLKPYLKDAAPEAPLGLPDLRLDPCRRIVWVRRGRGPWSTAEGLTPKEFDLLCVFLEHPGLTLTRAALMDRLWARRWGRVNPEVVDKQVGSLRRKLGPAGRRIETRRGRGYAFMAD